MPWLFLRLARPSKGRTKHLQVQRRLESCLLEGKGVLIHAQAAHSIIQRVDLDRVQVAGLGAALGVAQGLRPDSAKQGLDSGGEFIGVDVGVLAPIDAEEVRALKAAVLPVGGPAAVGRTTHVGHGAQRRGRQVRDTLGAATVQVHGRIAGPSGREVVSIGARTDGEVRLFGCGRWVCVCKGRRESGK